MLFFIVDTVFFICSLSHLGQQDLLNDHKCMEALLWPCQGTTITMAKTNIISNWVILMDCYKETNSILV